MTPLVVTTPKYRTTKRYFNAETGEIFNKISDSKTQLILDIDSAIVFLHLGYIPGNKTLFKNIICLPGGCDISIHNKSFFVEKQDKIKPYLYNDDLKTKSDDELIKIGGEKFLQSIGNLYKPNKNNVVPLSGGFDSRAILYGLAEYTDVKNIITYTFGMPGSFDYELATKVAKKLGTKHYTFNLEKVKLTEEKLIETALRTDGNTDLLQPYFLIDIVNFFGNNSIIWSGFTGDVLGGSHYFPKENNLNKNKIIADFISHEHKGLLPFSDEIFSGYIETDSIYKNIMSFKEELFWVNHIERYTTSQIFFNDTLYLNPFMEDDFLFFIFSLNPSNRKNKILFNSILKTRFKEAFVIPTKDELSGQLHQRILNKLSKVVPFIKYNKKLNYVNYYNYLRKENNQFFYKDFNSIKNKELFTALGINKENLFTRINNDISKSTQKMSLLLSLDYIITAFCK